MRVLAGLGVSLTLVVSQALSATPAAASGPDSPRSRSSTSGWTAGTTQPLGIDDASPLLGWQMVETQPSRGPPLLPARLASGLSRRPADRLPDPGRDQRARTCAKGRLIWDSGRVAVRRCSRACRYAGPPLGLARAGRLAGAGLGRRRPAVGLERARPRGRWACSSRATGERPAGSSTRDAPRASPCRSSPGSSRVDRRKQVSRAPGSTCPVSACTCPPLNGRTLTDEVLAPGNSNYQLSSEYRTYDVTGELRKGDNTLGVQLGNGPAYVRRSVTNPAVGRTSPYSWWQSQLKGSGALVADAAAGATTVKLDSVANYHVGGTINVDTGNGGDSLESRVITAIGTAGADGTGITFTPGLSKPHTDRRGGHRIGQQHRRHRPERRRGGHPAADRPAGDLLQPTGPPTSSSPTAAGAPRSAPLVTDAWYSGADYDARREQVGWDAPGADLSATAKRRDGSAMGWVDAGIAPPPNLATKLVARTRRTDQGRRDASRRSRVTNPVPGTWVFDFGQNIVGWPRAAPAGRAAGRDDHPDVAGRVARRRRHRRPGLADGRRRQPRASTCSTPTPPPACAGGETWHPDFNYFGMQWVQVTGLPEGFTPDRGHWSRACGCRPRRRWPARSPPPTRAINRIHTMARYSFAGNIMSVFTDCPGREKLSYPADYTMPMGAIHRNYDLDAYLRTTMRHLVEGQSIADTPMFGNVALKTPVYDWGYTGRFGDEINWGNAIILVPAHALRALRRHRDDGPLLRPDGQLRRLHPAARRSAPAPTRTSSTRPWPTGSPPTRPRVGSPAPGATTSMISKLADDGRS